ncbi:MAG TPA: DUF6544 family protein [Gemmatimonas sp.]|nr:DUF6544 family protein [Gemmatimonas sp.]
MAPVILRVAFVALLGLHGLIHLIGAAAAFGWVTLPALRVAVTPLAGALWLVAALLLVAAAAAFALGAHLWWWLALPGVVLSQTLIAQSWKDARFGTLANLVIAVPLVLAAIDARPSSFRSRFAHDREALLARPVRDSPAVTESDLAALPPLYQTYLRRVGAVGRPRVRNMRLQFDARMRSSATAPWMPAIATQYEFFDAPARLFYMNATRGAVPIDIYHRYVDSAATFQVRIASLWPMVDRRGPVLTKAETVTLMNDIVVMAPAAALDLPFTFTTSGERTLDATFSNAGHTVAAVLTFDAAGDLVGFLSNDRTQDDETGGRLLPWSTPISGYRDFDGIRIGARGSANWIEPSGDWTYGEFTITSIAYNVSR